MSSPDSIRWASDGLVPVVVQDVADGRVLMLAWANSEALARTLETGEVHFWSRSRSELWRKGETSGNVLHLRGLALDCDGDALLATVEPAGPTCHTGARSCFDAGGPIRGLADATGLAGAAVAATKPAAPAGELPHAGAPAPGGTTSAGSAGAEPTIPADDGAPPPEGFAWLETLWATIAARAAIRPEGSYTASLLAAGVDGPARKVAEEATEVLMAAKDDAVAERAGAERGELRAALAGEVADLVYHALVLLAERGLPPAAVIARLRERHAG